MAADKVQAATRKANTRMYIMGIISKPVPFRGFAVRRIQLQLKRATFWNEQLTLPSLAGSFRALSAR